MNDQSEVRAGGDAHLKGKPVTVVYEIVDPDEWRKTNPLHYEHHGLRAVTVSASDLAERCERLEKGLRIIANLERDDDKFCTDEQIALRYLNER